MYLIKTTVWNQKIRLRISEASCSPSHNLCISGFWTFRTSSLIFLFIFFSFLDWSPEVVKSFNNKRYCKSKWVWFPWAFCSAVAIRLISGLAPVSAPRDLIASQETPLLCRNKVIVVDAEYTLTPIQPARFSAFHLHARRVILQNLFPDLWYLSSSEGG